MNVCIQVPIMLHQNSDWKSYLQSAVDVFVKNTDDEAYKVPVSPYHH